MRRLEKIGIGLLLRNYRSRSKAIPAEVSEIASDLWNQWAFLKEYEGHLVNTPVYPDVVPNSGLDGTSLVVDSSIRSGFLFNKNKSRPKTIKETLTDISKVIDTSLSDSTVPAELLKVKNKIGASLFEEGVESDPTSISNKIENINKNLSQIVADVFNVQGDIGNPQDLGVYNLVNDGLQTQEYSIRDLINKLINAHGDLNTLGHSDVRSKTVWSSSFLASQAIPAAAEKYTSLFANSFEDFEDSISYINVSEDLKVLKMAVYVKSNSLMQASELSLVKNGIPTSLTVRIPAGETGIFENVVAQEEIPEGTSIKFIIKTGNIPSGSIHIENLSLILR